MSFPCTACGACCTSISQIPRALADTDLLVGTLGNLKDRGDGTCVHYDEDTKRCRIYEGRPLVCQVENLGKRLLQPKGLWYAMNLKYCDILHFDLYGVKREQEGVCPHKVSGSAPGQIRDY
jgi:Fe-S-cluster containining protein